MPVLAVIPARMESSRLPGKVLLDLLGAPMILHVLERVKKARRVDQVIVATDSYQVQSVIAENGGTAVMTRPDHTCGSDRIAEVADGQPEYDVIINVQADQPLIHPEALDALVDAHREHLDPAPMATLVTKIQDPAKIRDPNTVKVVFNRNGHAVYFSRSPIPYRMGNQGPSYYKHVGVYLFRRDFLLGYRDLPPSALEVSERLEQLRAIEAGYPIQVVKTPHDCPSVETQADLDAAREIMRIKGHRP